MLRLGVQEQRRATVETIALTPVTPTVPARYPSISLMVALRPFGHAACGKEPYRIGQSRDDHLHGEHRSPPRRGRARGSKRRRIDPHTTQHATPGRPAWRVRGPGTRGFEQDPPFRRRDRVGNRAPRPGHGPAHRACGTAGERGSSPCPRTDTALGRSDRCSCPDSFHAVPEVPAR